jgi:hypothetical protein
MRVPILLLFASTTIGLACSDEASDGGNSTGGAPSAGSGGRDAGQTGSGAPGSGGADTGGEASDGGRAASAGETNPAGATSSGGAACHGDAADWDDILSGSLQCESDADCCVVVNDCLSQARVVHLDVFEQAQSAWPYCDEECNDCVAPQVIVACVDGSCVGILDDESGDAGESHCGNEAPIDAAPTEVSFGCE